MKKLSIVLWVLVPFAVIANDWTIPDQDAQSIFFQGIWNRSGNAQNIVAKMG